ncbi:hypothetical protein AEM51_12915 [Bacteroidetes bacterium UKL13-3]|nr:hypothetical protein AEM51_12915 [Bacteroidetes bacterium UKL13-3]HCP93908.1 hypothetical protein [Bacteroidota bacterium]
MSAFVTTYAQNADKTPDIKYRRSSLHTILLEADNFPNKEVVIQAYNTSPFPDKYNDHNIGIKSFNPKNYGATAKSAADADKEISETQPAIDRFIADQKIANKLVAKWFNRKVDGSFDMQLIGERGAYNASDMEANIAKGSARGASSLADAGEELIGNTFVVFSKVTFLSNEVFAAGIRDASKLAANQMPNPMMQQVAIKSADALYEKTKEGYSVWTTSYLYKLKWNDSIAAIFYNDLWFDKSSVSPSKKEAFDKTNLFSLEFVGQEKATSLVTFSLKEKRTESQIIALSTVRNVDAVYAKLQKKYDVFKPKVPLYTGYPITAKIGMKEGLEGGEKFEVLEQVIDPKTGLTKYESKGTIKVDKKLLWDNRFNAGEESSTETDTTKPVIDRTTFKGGKKFYSGMLIRQLK